jgi:hypothetical protein
LDLVAERQRLSDAKPATRVRRLDLPTIVVAAGTAVASKRLKRLDRVEDITDVRTFGDAKATGHGITDDRAIRGGRPGFLTIDCRFRFANGNP